MIISERWNIIVFIKENKNEFEIGRIDLIIRISILDCLIFFFIFLGVKVKVGKKGNIFILKLVIKIYFYI